MLGNFAFTLYEIFGYLLPGGIALLGFGLLYWAFLIPSVLLGTLPLQPGIGTWTIIILASYILGHAAQAVGNLAWTGVEESVLGAGGSAPDWLRECAREAAARALKVDPEVLKPRWLFRIADEVSLQTGKAGDRDMYVYREGFYRGTAVALCFLFVTLLLTVAIPYTTTGFGRWLRYVSRWPLLASAVVIGGVAWLFVRRFRRFAEYRVTRTVLAFLALENRSPTPASVDPGPTPGRE